MSDGLHGRRDDEMNPNLPKVNLDLPVAAEKRRLLTAMSSEPTYYSAHVDLPDTLDDALSGIEYLRRHARVFLGEGGNDIFSAQYLKMFAEKAAGNRVRLKIELEVLDG